MNRLVGGVARIALAAMVVIVAAPPGRAVEPVEQRPLHVAKGASSATVKGVLRGRRIVDYTVRARAGQTLDVALQTDHAGNAFNVLPPGSGDVALYVGLIHGNAWRTRLEADGDYRIRVYLVRSAARRGETARYALTVSVTGEAAGAPSIGSAPAGDVKVPGTPYHATGRVPCAIGAASGAGARCAFGVIRGRPGDAEVHLTAPDGTRRVLTFRGDAVRADGGAAVTVRRHGDERSIDVGDREHYRIPDALVSGG